MLFLTESFYKIGFFIKRKLKKSKSFRKLIQPDKRLMLKILPRIKVIVENYI